MEGDAPRLRVVSLVPFTSGSAGSRFRERISNEFRVKKEDRIVIGKGKRTWTVLQGIVITGEWLDCRGRLIYETQHT